MRTAPVGAALDAVVRRDRLVVVSALAAVIALSWAYLLADAGMGMSAFEMTGVSPLGMARGMTGVALFVRCEKTVPARHWLGYATGGALLVWGAWTLALAF